MNKQYYKHLCLCGCGNQIETKSHHKYYGIPKYIHGHGKTIRNSKHGECDTRLYRIWSAMKRRCFNSNCESYKYYGNRGITVCNNWLEFIPFRDWALNNGYADNLQINRIKNDGNYEPSNCQWIVSKINCRNRRNNKLTVEKVQEIKNKFKKDKYSKRKLAKEYNVSSTLIANILNNHQWK